MSKTWVLITPEDTCAWQLKEAPLDGEPSLEQCQMYVDGYIEEVKQSWLMEGLYTMYVNEDAGSKELPHNQLATQLLEVVAPLRGTAIIQWDDKYNTKLGWMDEEEVV